MRAEIVNDIIATAGVVLAVITIGWEIHAMAGMPKPIKLDESAAKAYDSMVKAGEQVSKMRKHDKAAREAKNTLKDAFGDAKLGQLPDGRIIQRSVKEQNRSAQKAKTVEIVTFSEFPTD